MALIFCHKSIQLPQIDRLREVQGYSVPGIYNTKLIQSQLVVVVSEYGEKQKFESSPQIGEYNALTETIMYLIKIGKPRCWLKESKNPSVPGVQIGPRGGEGKRNPEI
jgi:hypothetical protein